MKIDWKKILHQKVTCKKVIIGILILFFLGGIIFSSRKGYYYPLVGKKNASSEFVVRNGSECKVSWVGITDRGKSYVDNERKYKRYINVVSVNSEKIFCIGFWNASLIIDTENQEKEYVSLFWRDNSSPKVTVDHIAP